jgi:geranylgeranyl reductase family protein
MNRYDVIIVGGGPAGSTMAGALTRAGRRVMVLDKADFPRDKTCAGWVTPAVLASLQVDPDHYARTGRVLQPIHRFRIGLMGQSAVENHHGDEPVSYGIRRCEFDHFLLERVGCDKALGEKLTSLTREGGLWTLNDRYRAPLLIGAGGHFCPVARYLGCTPGKHERAVLAREVEFRLSDETADSCPIPADQPELWFCRDLKGYAWVFRKGDWLNVGLGREDPEKLGDHLQSFVDAMRAAGRLPGDLPRRYKGHAYLLYDHARRPVTDDGVMLIGDAAGLAYTQSGEGIRTAVESALLASDVVVHDCPLSDYAERLESRFGPRRGDVGQSWLPGSLKRGAASVLMRSHWFTRKIVTQRWFLHEHVPALMPELRSS